MKNIFFCFFFARAITSCTSLSEQTTRLPPDVFTEKTDTSLRNENGIWMLSGQKYNGYIVEKDSNILVAKLPIIDGKENGLALGWYKNGKKRYELNFLHGNRDGTHKGWHPNDTLSFSYFFHEDKYEGEQNTYFPSGHRFQCLNYVNGYEDGKQKSWNDSLRVINNFTVKNGKLYGVIGRYDCMSVIKK
jgi:antitoxin component YwqK of YwqJK toxin-antitoxin module